MSDLADRLHKEFEKLKTRRDELRVQLDLGKMDAKDAWKELDGKWTEAERKMKQLAQVSRNTADEISDTAGDLIDDTAAGLKLTAAEVGDSAEKLLDEIREGFSRLRGLL